MQNNDANAQIEGRYDLCALNEFGESNCLEFRLGEGDWPLRVFIVREGERLTAYRNVCPHAGMPLNWKLDTFLTKDQSAIICATHGAMFTKESGECFAGPCVGRRLKRYEVSVDEDERVVVTITAD